MVVGYCNLQVVAEADYSRDWLGCIDLGELDHEKEAAALFVAEQAEENLHRMVAADFGSLVEGLDQQ